MYVERWNWDTWPHVKYPCVGYTVLIESIKIQQTLLLLFEWVFFFGGGGWLGFNNLIIGNVVPAISAQSF